MKDQTQTKRRAPNWPFYIFAILMLLSLLVTATYTWFTLSRTPRVSNLGLYVNAPVGMQLAATPEGEWVNRLDFAQLVPETSPLRPVTWSERQQRFLAAEYGIDGRQTGNFHPLSDANNANRDDAYGYYIKATFYATSDAAVDVSLTHAMELEEGVSGHGTYLIGSPVWDANDVLHFNGGNGAETAVRIGLRITPLVQLQPDMEQTLFYIYEPNCDTHMDGSRGYVPTPSIDGADSLVSQERLIRQTTTAWREADPVQHGLVNYTMGDFETPTDLFSLKTGQIVQIDLYVWLEGQDVDCSNLIGRDARIMANVQFLAQSGDQSGLEPIPEN